MSHNLLYFSVLVVNSSMGSRYGECDNLQCDTAHWSVIQPKLRREAPVDIANKFI